MMNNKTGKSALFSKLGRTLLLTCFLTFSAFESARADDCVKMFTSKAPSSFQTYFRHFTETIGTETIGKNCLVVNDTNYEGADILVLFIEDFENTEMLPPEFEPLYRMLLGVQRMGMYQLDWIATRVYLPRELWSKVEGEIAIVVLRQLEIYLSENHQQKYATREFTTCVAAAAAFGSYSDSNKLEASEEALLETCEGLIND